MPHALILLWMAGLLFSIHWFRHPNNEKDQITALFCMAAMTVLILLSLYSFHLESTLPPDLRS